MPGAAQRGSFGYLLMTAYEYITSNGSGNRAARLAMTKLPMVFTYTYSLDADDRGGEYWSSTPVGDNDETARNLVFHGSVVHTSHNQPKASGKAIRCLLLTE